MIAVYLFVVGIFNADGFQQDQSEEWGWIELACSPNIGDLIHTWHSHNFHVVRIKSIMHRAVLIPPSEIGLQKPSLEVEAEWVTIDLSSYKNY